MNEPLRGLLGILCLCATVACSAAASAVDIVVPRDGARTSGESRWVVVRSDALPELSSEGRSVPAARSEGRYHHFLVSGLSAAGARVEIRSGEELQVLTLYGGAGERDPFHTEAQPQCAACHDGSASGCGECHRPAGGKHRPVLDAGCARCHRPPAWGIADIAGICTECHETYRDGKHPRLRHAVASDRDPSRPGRKMDCASCHDPHAPECLGCLGRAQLREWCKRCHGGPS